MVEQETRKQAERRKVATTVRHLRHYLYRVRQVYDHCYSSQVHRRWWPAFVLLDDMKDHLPFLIDYLEMSLEESEKPTMLEWPESLIEFEERRGVPIAGPRAFTSEQKRELFFKAKGRCCICRAKLDQDWHADHVEPWIRGGETTVENGQALCPTCNLRKNAKDFSQD
jgi:5-methylcytosine-specific restriction endonuclease McrA